MIRFSTAALAATAFCGLTAAAAQDAGQNASDEQGFALGWSASANVAFVSDYRFRGVSFSNGEFAVQGGFDLAHESGFYVGTWASSIEEYGASVTAQIVNDVAIPVFSSGAENEVDLYAGYGFSAGALSYDLGVLHYMYPGSEDTDYTELYGSVSGAAGAAGLTGGIAWVPDQDNAGGDNFYLYADAGLPLGETGLTAAFHLGYTDGAFVFSGDDQFDWSAGLSATVKGLDWSATYVATDADIDFGGQGLPPERVDVLEEAADDLYGHTIVFAVSKSL